MGFHNLSLCSKSPSLSRAPNGIVGSGRPGEGERAAVPNSQDKGICGFVVCCGEGLGQAVRSVTSLGGKLGQGRREKP